MLRTLGAEEPRSAMRELFSRIVFNVAIGNNDDHARNIAAFWDGQGLSLTPAYDLCPQPRSGETSTQAIAISRDGTKDSSFLVCANAAADYLLERRDAAAIIDHQIDVIRAEWSEAADAARLSRAERDRLRHRQILNPFATRDWS